MQGNERQQGSWLGRLILALMRVIAGSGPARLAQRTRLGAGGSALRIGGRFRVGSGRRPPFTGRRPLAPERSRPRLDGPVGELADRIEAFLNAEQPTGYVVAAEVGARVVRFGIEPARVERWDRQREETVVEQVSVRRVTRRAAQLATLLEVSPLRVVEPAPGQPFVAVELPHDEPRTVQLEALLATPAYSAFARLAKVPAVLGEDLGGRPFLVDLAMVPHLLIVGGRETERIEVLAAALASVCARRSPEETRLLLLGSHRSLQGIEALPHGLPGGGAGGAEGPEGPAGPGRVAPGARSVREATVDRLGRLERVIARRLEALRQQGEAPRQPRDGIESVWPVILVAIPQIESLLAEVPMAEAALERLIALGQAAGVCVVAAAGDPQASRLLRSSLWAQLALATPNDGTATLPGSERLLDDGDFLYREPVEGQAQPRGYGAIRRGQAPRVSPNTVRGIARAWGAPVGRDPLGQLFAVSTGADPARAELERQARALAAEIDAVTPRILERRLRVGSALARALWQQLQAEGRV